MDHPTQQLPPQPPQPPQPPEPPQPARPPRRSGWVMPAVLGALLLAGVLIAAVVIAGPGAANRNAGGVAISDMASLDALLQQAADPADPTAANPDAKNRPFPRGRKGHGPLRLRDGEKVLAGSVSSVADGKLVVRKDSGAEVTVPTDGDTRVGGAQNKALSDLQAGERVIVKVGSDGIADGVLAVKAHAAGTVTKLDGDRATVVRAGGLSTVLDLSGVPDRPAVGTVVIAVGTATDDGATLKVEQIKELPTLG